MLLDIGDHDLVGFLREIDVRSAVTAHAVALDVTLVTNNETDFAGYPGLRIENWVT